MHELVDTIAALATPPGQGALAVVRISGAGTGRVVRAVVPELPWPPEPRRACLVELLDPDSGQPVDQGLLTWFPAPDSYTGEDVAEFSGHGGGLAPRLVLDALHRAGARTAEPGEFTRRAYLNGKMDLVQAEAVADLIEGRSQRLQKEALRQLDRHLSRRLADLRETVVDLEAVLAHHIDFPEEDEPPVALGDIAQRGEELVRALQTLAETAPEGERLREGALVVLAGRPNAGKSSLYNALVGEERALVTEIPGTTRDALEAHVSMDGYPVRLVDTAGLRDSDGVVERMGIEVARRFLDHADLVLYCVPLDEEATGDEEEWIQGLDAPVVRVRTMADRPSQESAGASHDHRPVAAEVEVSVVDGRGLGTLRRAVAQAVFGRLRAVPDDAPVLMRARQARGVRKAASEVREFVDSLGGGVPVEYAASHLKAAQTALEEVVGVVESEEVLDRLFSSFCIGK